MAWLARHFGAWPKPARPSRPATWSTVSKRCARCWLGDRSRLWVDLHRTAAAAVVYANPPDFAEMQAWRRHLRPGELYIDVGANVGTYAIWAAELGAEVIALEPAPDTFALLQENIAL